MKTSRRRRTTKFATCSRARQTMRAQTTTPPHHRPSWFSSAVARHRSGLGTSSLPTHRFATKRGQDLSSLPKVLSPFRSKAPAHSENPKAVEPPEVLSQPREVADLAGVARLRQAPGQRV